MKSRILFTATLVALGALGATAAAQNAGAESRHGRMQLDSNGDGAIDRAEAAAHPRLAERFDRLDRNGDGRLDADERPARRGKGMHGGRGHIGHVGRMGHMGHDGIARLDADDDGRISRAELEAGAGAGGGGGRGSQHGLLQHFDAIDANGDGHIVRAELRGWHQARRPQRQAEMATRFEERFAAADLNGDGRLSRVEVGEKMPRLVAGFAWMDENGDGVLSREELRPQPMR